MLFGKLPNISFFVPILLLTDCFIYLCNGDESIDCAAVYICAECIQIPACGWCSRIKEANRTIATNEAACFRLTDLEIVCEKGFSEAPEPSMTLIKDEKVVENRNGKTIQLQPQELSMYIRTGTSYTIDFKFKKANDYPIDVYYLLDFSRSMRTYKQKLAQLGTSLAQELQQRTSSLQLGFGSFVDKVTLPYTSTVPELFESTCPGCAKPYSFRNHLPLNNDTTLFSKVLTNAKMSANEDTPEGGFDGLLQAMVCNREINWRQFSRRIVVLCTDAPFHIAGDGKLGGVVEPHDGKCHLDSEGDFYTHGLELDYPSVSLINAKAKEQSINVIFAATPNAAPVYDRLRHAIEGSSVGVLKDKEDVIKLVLEQYNSMSVQLTITDNATGPIEIDYMVKCPGKDWKNGKECTDLKGGNEVYFRALIKVNNCSIPEDTIEIKPIGMVESLKVRLKVHCNCDCEKSTHKTYQTNSSECSGGGDLVCGRCDCLPSHYGRRCECKQRDLSFSSVGINSCRRGNVTCSGRGTCFCGTCRCQQPSKNGWRVSGQFCECDNFSCPGGATLCSGHGLCVCGRCLCDADWKEDDCSCSTDQQSCKSPGDDQVCSGRGQCHCGKCRCDSDPTTGKKYSGDYCERCTACKVECTSQMNECINCLVYKAADSVGKNCENCTALFQNISLVSDASEKKDTTETSSLCREVEDNGCAFQYVPFYQDEQLWVFVDKEKTCSKPLNIVAIGTGVAGSTVLAGIILLLLWKLITVIHDKREYEKFEKQRAETKWGRSDNPLYRKALTTHLNPTFEG